MDKQSNPSEKTDWKHLMRGFFESKTNPASQNTQKTPLYIKISQAKRSPFTGFTGIIGKIGKYYIFSIPPKNSSSEIQNSDNRTKESQNEDQEE